MRWYLAGPMSGIPQFNFPMFQAAAKELREHGYDIVSPAELDDPETYANAMASPDGDAAKQGRSWGDFLARDVKIVADQVQGVIVLPGWQTSRGARLEVFVAQLCKHQLCVYIARPFARMQGVPVRPMSVSELKYGVAA